MSQLKYGKSSKNNELNTRYKEFFHRIKNNKSITIGTTFTGSIYCGSKHYWVPVSYYTELEDSYLENKKGE